MNRFARSLPLAVALALAPAAASAQQLELPRPSPTAKLTQQIGLTEVTVEYSSRFRIYHDVYAEVLKYVLAKPRRTAPL